MQGQVFTVAKLHYINGVVYFAAQEGSTTLATLAKHSAETTKSGDVKHPAVRVRTLVRLAEGLGLVVRPEKTIVKISDLGQRYHEARAKGKWTLSDQQQEILQTYIRADPSRTPTIHAITSLLALVEKGHSGKELSRQYAAAIGKEVAWQSDITYEGFTNFGLSYLVELGFLDKDLRLQHPRTNQSTGVPKARTRRTFLFTWNPEKWEWKDLPQAIYEANAEGCYLDGRSCGVLKDIVPGDRFFLMRVGVPPKGIIGSGVVDSAPFEDLHWDTERAEHGDKTNFVKVRFNALNAIPVINEKMLTSGALGKHNWFPQASATHIPDEIAAHLEALWAQTSGTVPPPLSEPEETQSVYLEGAKKSRLVTTYERDPGARQACLKHHGRSCQACGFVFEKQYGDIGQGFIHVHHVVPVSKIKKEYEVDSVKDLFPVCPNCHAMLHKRTPPYTIKELKEIMNTYGKKLHRLDS